MLGTPSILMYNSIAYTRYTTRGEICSSPMVTLKMKKWFWAQYYKLEVRAEGAKLSYEDRGRGGAEGI